VIIGGGVVGLSTAYSLALALKDASASDSSAIPMITVIEPSNEISPAASTHATGGIGDFGSKSNPSVASVAKLSYNMHVKMAAEHNGAEKYGFSEQVIYRLTPRNFTGTPSPPDNAGTEIPPTPVPLSELPDWVRTSDHWEAQRMASGPQCSHLNPRLFCPFLAEQVAGMVVRIELGASVISVESNEAEQEFSRVQIRRASGSVDCLPCRAVVLATGPWSDRVFAQLFPNARITLPMNSTDAAGNHFRVKSPGWESEAQEYEKSVQVYYMNVTPDGSRFDVTSFANGDLYIGGWGARPEVLPDLATSVRPQPSEIEAMISATKRYVTVDPNKELEYFDVGRCYHPSTTTGRPIITKVDWYLLGIGDSFEALLNTPSESSDIVGGLFINTGHDSSGGSQALGSGKVMSD
ncbi:nucleotide-binding domain-containing protein, partial [Lophiostoma macrostomum CBS 122681]